MIADTPDFGEDLAMGRHFAPLELDAVERAELTSLASRRSTGQGLALRARIVLACAEGEQSKVVAARLAVDPDTVSKWRRRFSEHRLEGLWDEPRSGTPRTIEDARIEAVIVRTLETQPADATHWSSRSMARASGLSVSKVQRIWRAFGLQPHRLETFKLSTDPDFVAKVRNIVGLYVAPPERAIVLCVDEKAQIQALDRSQPMLPRRRAGVTTTSATAPHRCLPPLTSQPAGLSASVTGAIAPKSSASSSMRSKPLFQTIWTSTSSWTITQPIRPR
jgi:transposase